MAPSFFPREDVITIVGIGQRFVLLGPVEEQRLGYDDMSVLTHGKTMGKWENYRNHEKMDLFMGFMVVLWDLMGFYEIYPLVN